jgi:hypothetical protein
MSSAQMREAEAYLPSAQYPNRPSRRPPRAAQHSFNHHERRKLRYKPSHKKLGYLTAEAATAYKQTERPVYQLIPPDCTRPPAPAPRPAPPQPRQPVRQASSVRAEPSAAGTAGRRRGLGQGYAGRAPRPPPRPRPPAPPRPAPPRSARLRAVRWR